MKLAQRAILSALLVGLPAWAAPAGDELVLEVGGTRQLGLGGFVKADVFPVGLASVVVGAEGVQLRGNEPGVGRLCVWDQNSQPHLYRVKVLVAGTNLGGELERSLADTLANDPQLRGQGITVKLVGGTAVLGGSADSAALAQRAVDLMRARVPSVSNLIRVGDANLGGGVLPVGDAGTFPTPLLAPGGEALPLRAPLLSLEAARAQRVLELRVNEAVAITVPTQLKRVMTAEPTLADVIPMPPRTVVVTGKAVGETTVFVWYLGADAFLGQEAVASFAVRVVAAGKPEVGPDVAIAETFRLILAALKINTVQVFTRFSPAGVAVVLTGTVATKEDRDRVEALAKGLFFEPNMHVVNLVQVVTEVPNQAYWDKLAAELEKDLAAELPSAWIRVRALIDPTTGRVRVMLSGEAQQPADRLKANELTRFKFGELVQVTDSINVPPPPLPKPLAELFGKPADAPKPDAKVAAKMKVEDAIMQALETCGVPHARVNVSIDKPGKLVLASGTVRVDEDKEKLSNALTGALSEDVLGEKGWNFNGENLVAAAPKIMTQVQILELSTNDNLNLGLVWGQPQGGTTGGGSSSSSGTGSNTLQVISTSGELALWGQRTLGSSFMNQDPVAASIRALVSNNRARVLSEPNVTSDNGVLGKVEVVEEIPLPSTTSSSGGNTSSAVEFKPVGLRLEVTPTLDTKPTEERIKLNLKTEISAVDYGISVNINGSVIPAATTRRAETQVTVKDGETLVIGGLTTEQERKNVAKIPGLGDLPLIGALFQYKVNANQQTTVVLIMTPHIIW